MAEIEDLDWEEWDPERGSFAVHMMAGSAAGVTEHCAMFPIDTLKTHIQCHKPRKICNSRFWCRSFSAIEFLRREGFMRLWRGVNTMVIGCIPAHAAYFSVIEICKEKFGVNKPGHHPFAAASTGAIATIFHDAVMTPMDMIKQRLQLGYYRGITDCVRTVYLSEGASAFFLSLPITLLMNIPYGCIMVASNESLKRLLRPKGDYELHTHLLAGTGAGALASALTTPLDVIKTRLQTQHISGSPAKLPTEFKNNGVSTIQVRAAFTLPAAKLGEVRKGNVPRPRAPLKYQGLMDAAKHVHRTEGWRGFYRGMVPRLLVQAPSVAISWTTYEEVKKLLS